MNRRTTRTTPRRRREDTFQSACKRLLAPGAKYREAKQEAFDRARPILADLAGKFPAIDVTYCLWLLGNLIERMAPLKDPNVVTSWRALIKAYGGFKDKVEAFRLATGQLNKIRASLTAGEKWARDKGERVRWIPAEEIAGCRADPLNATFDPAFQSLDKKLGGLAEYYGLSLTSKKRGRPSYLWIDVVAWLLAEHFEAKIEEKPSTPQWSKWPTIANLLSCAPLPGDLPSNVLDPSRIRQRRVQWKQLEDRGGQDPGLWPYRVRLESDYTQWCGDGTERGELG